MRESWVGAANMYGKASQTFMNKEYSVYAQRKERKKKWQQIYIIKKITISDKLKTHWQINRTLLLITTREVTVALFFNVAELGVCFKLTKDKSDMGSVIIERIERKTGWHVYLLSFSIWRKIYLWKNLK